MTNRVYAPMDRTQPPSLKPPLDRAAAEPEADKLRPRDDTVLPLGKGPDRRIRATRGTFPIYMTFNVLRVRHAAHDRGPRHTRQRGGVTEPLQPERLGDDVLLDL